MGIHANDDTRVITEDNIHGLDGYIGINADDNIRTLGLQNFYGHVMNFLHNVIVHSDNKVWVKKDFINADTWPTYSNTIAKGREELYIALPGIANDTWVSELVCNFA